MFGLNLLETLFVFSILIFLYIYAFIVPFVKRKLTKRIEEDLITYKIKLKDYEERLGEKKDEYSRGDLKESILFCTNRIAILENKLK